MPCVRYFPSPLSVFGITPFQTVLAHFGESDPLDSPAPGYHGRGAALYLPIDRVEVFLAQGGEWVLAR
ncbi:hypothetical protein, partial [Mesorhizobium sp. P5_C1]